jgi:hypothetical protein
MRCRYCNQRLNLFKSLSRSSFCSHEHQKLYEEAEANKGFERLLQFVEKDPKSGPGKPVAAPASSPFTKADKQEAKPDPPSAPVPPAAPVPQTVAAMASDRSSEPAVPDPPIAGFLLAPIAPAATDSGNVNPNFEVLEAGFPAAPAALPSVRFELAVTDVQKLGDLQKPEEEPPPPLASWLATTLNPVLSAMDVAAATVEVPSVDSVRPRTMGLTMPAADNLPLAPVAPPTAFSGDSSGLQPAIQVVIDTRDFRNLARLNPLQREVRTSSETAQWPAEKSVVSVLSRPLPAIAPPMVFSGDASGLQPAIQAVIDTKDFRNLARLSPLQREVRTSSETAQWPAAESVVLVLSRPDALELDAAPEAKAGTGLNIGMTEAARAQQLPVALGSSAIPRMTPSVQTRRDALQSDGFLKAMAGIGVTLGMSGSVNRTGVGRNVSAPAALPPRLCFTLRPSEVQGTILAKVQRTRDPDLPAILPRRFEPNLSRGPAQPPAVAAGLSRRSFAALKIDQADRAAAIVMNGAMTRAEVARHVRQPQPQPSRLVNSLGSIEILNRVVAGVQNTPDPPDCAIAPAMRVQRECVQPVETAPPVSPTGIRPVVAPSNLTISESDTPLAVGITNAKKPADVSSPLFIPQVSASRRSFKIGMNRTARKVPAQVQARDASISCAISPARQALRDCLLPAILWSAETWLKSAIASVGWFHESDCSMPAFPSGAPAARLFSIRFQVALFSTDVPVLGFDRVVHSLVQNACEWKTGLPAKEQEALRLARSQPARTSPLSLVTKPRPLGTRLAARYIRSLNQFNSIANRGTRGVAPSAAASASADEHQPIIALPKSTPFGLAFAFRLLSSAALKSPPVEPAEHKNTQAGSRPRPSPLRIQPASMLILPGWAIPVGGIRWRASGGWATIASPSLPKQTDIQVSSSAETSLSSLRCLADALRVDSAVTQEFMTLRVNPRPPSISLDLGAQTSAPGIVAANALPRRRGPKLPVATSQLDDLIVAGR